mgnify:CR=1 FL=1
MLDKMESETPPRASSPPRVEDPEVSSQRVSPGSGEVRERTNAAPEAADKMEGATPMETGHGGPGSSDPQLDIIPETQTVPESDRQPPLREGETATSMNAEAPNKLMDSLRGASVLVEHRALNGTVVEKVQSAKSELDEAFMSLLTGFEV